MVLRLLPNAITLVRLFLAPVIAWLILQGRFREALALVVLAGLTDWLDGFLARRLDVTGKLGIVLDPLADKVLLVTLFIVLTAARLIPFWLLALVMGRDLVIVGGALLLRLFRDIHRFPPSTMGKVSTFFQIVFVLMVLLYAAYPYQILLWLRTLALGLTALFTLLSWIDYVRLGIRLTVRQPASS